MPKFEISRNYFLDKSHLLMAMSEKDLRELQEEYKNLPKNDEDLSEHSVPLAENKAELQSSDDFQQKGVRTLLILLLKLSTLF